MAAGDMFLEFSGKGKFDGESPDDKFKDKIQVLSFSFGVSNSGTGAVGTGSGASKAAFSDLSVTKYADKSTPNFFINCVNGTHHEKAILHIRKSGENPQEYLTITMEEVFITSFSHSGADGGGLPTESATLNFSKMEVSYKPQKADGTLDAANKKGWSVKEQKPYTA
jgi:type VI secretion system secreted protein Hcp